MLIHVHTGLTIMYLITKKKNHVHSTCKIIIAFFARQSTSCIHDKQLRMHEDINTLDDLMQT